MYDNASGLVCCLTLHLQRPHDITVRAQDEEGRPCSCSWAVRAKDAGIARIFQHEYCHLQVAVTACRYVTSVRAHLFAYCQAWNDLLMVTWSVISFQGTIQDS
jgi:hypothetical protein